MRPIGSLHRFRGSIHVIRSGPAVDMDIDESGGNVALFQFNQRSVPGRRLTLNGGDLPAANQEIRIRKNGIGQDETAPQAEVGGHLLSI